MKYKRRPDLVDAVQWFKQGDHPQLQPATCLRERGYKECPNCQGQLEDHGFVDNEIGGYIICPGDWVITDIFNKVAPMKDDVFKLLYEPIN